MMGLRWSLLLSLILVLFNQAEADKIYKTYQDYIAGKPMFEGTVKADNGLVTVSFFIIKITTTGGGEEKINIKDIWGFERTETNGPMADSVLIYRTIGGKLYYCVSEGKYLCWVSAKGNLMVMPMSKDRIFCLMPGNNNNQGSYWAPNGGGQYRQVNDGGDPDLKTCLYSTGIGAECEKLGYAHDFLSLITPEEKKAVWDKMKKSGLVGYPYYAIQYYNMLFPAPVAK